MARYRKLADGETREIPGARGRFVQRTKCCDCGLVHVTLTEVTSPSSARFTAWRDKRATAAGRRVRRAG